MSNPDKTPKSRTVSEKSLEVDEWFIDVSIIDDDDPDPPPGGRKFDPEIMEIKPDARS